MVNSIYELQAPAGHLKTANVLEQVLQIRAAVPDEDINADGLVNNIFPDRSHWNDERLMMVLVYLTVYFEEKTE